MDSKMKTEEYLWVIKDQEGNFANKNSIKKPRKDIYQYIAFKTFSPECRGNINKEESEYALIELNRKKDIMCLGTTFHLEYNILEKMIDQYEAFSGENMIIVEKTNFNCSNSHISDHLSKVI